MPDNVVSIRLVVQDDGTVAIKRFSTSVEELGKQAAAGSTGMVTLNKTGAELKGIFDGMAQSGASLLGRFSPLVTVMGGVGSVIAATGYAAYSAVSYFTAFATQIRDLSYLSGGSARQVSILTTGLEDLGVESGTVETAIARMSRAVQSGDPALNKLGISARDASGHLKTGNDIFYEVIDGLHGMGNEVERNTIAQEIFGRGWTTMVPAILKGSDAIKALGEANVAAGKGMDEYGIRKAEEYRAAINDLSASWEGLKLNAAKPLLLPITLLIQAAASGLGAVGQLAPPTGAQTQAAWLARRNAEIAAGVFDPSGKVLAGWPDRGASDVGAWRMGGAGLPVVAGAPAGATEAELADRVRAQQREELLASASATLAGAMPAGMGRINAQAAAAEQVLREQREKADADLDLQIKKGTVKKTDEAAERLVIEKSYQAKLAALQFSSDEQRRTQRIADNKLQTADQARLLDEYSILQAANLSTDSAAQERYRLQQLDFDEQARTQKAAEDAEEERRRQAIREAGAAYDDTANQMYVGDYKFTEGQITAARAEGLARRQHLDADTAVGRKAAFDLEVANAVNAWVKETGYYDDENRKQLAIASGKFSELKRHYDDDVTAQINANLLATGIYKDEGRKQLDIIAGTYESIEARRQLDLKNLATYYLIVASQNNDVWAAMTSGAITTYASLGTFWGNVTKGFTDTFGNVRTSLSDGFFDILTGDFDKLSDVVKNFGLSMLRTFTDILAAEATRGLLNLVITLGSGGQYTLGYGGTGGGSGTSGAVVGGLNLVNAASGAASSGGGGSVGSSLLGALPFGGILQGIDTLTGGTISTYLSGLFSSSGAVSGPATTGALLDALSSSTAAASDLGLASATGVGLPSAAGAGTAAGGVAAAGAASAMVPSAELGGTALAVAGSTGEPLVAEGLGTAAGATAGGLSGALMGGIVMLPGIIAGLEGSLSAIKNAKKDRNISVEHWQDFLAAVPESPDRQAFGGNLSSLYAALTGNRNPGEAPYEVLSAMAGYYFGSQNWVGGYQDNKPWQASLMRENEGAWKPFVRSHLAQLADWGLYSTFTGAPEFYAALGTAPAQTAEQAAAVQAAAQIAANQAGWGSSSFASTGFDSRQSGGPVWPGWSGTVGEEGIERLTIGPRGFGYVTPLTEPSEPVQGGDTVHIEVHVHNTGIIGTEQFSSQVARKIWQAWERQNRSRITVRSH